MPQTSKIRSLSMSDPTRRHMLAGGLALAGVGMTGVGASAMTTTEAERLIQQVVSDVEGIINSGKSENAMIQDFGGIFDRYGDVTRIGQALLGAPWRTTSSADQRAFITAVRGYLARKYGRRFREFTGARIVINTSKDYGRKGIIVNTTVSTSVFAPFSVDWHVIEAGGSRRFFNLIIEGLGLIAAERSEIGSLMDRNGGSVPAVVAALNTMG